MNDHIAISARLAVASEDDLPFDEITEALGVQPTWARRPDEWPIPALGGVFQWLFRLEGVYPVPELPQLDDQTRIPYPEVMTPLTQLRDAIGDGVTRFAAWRRTRDDVSVWVTIGIQCDSDELPLLTLDGDFVEFAAQLGAGVDYDVYLNTAASDPAGREVTEPDDAV
jgi:hypothetical protein